MTITLGTLKQCDPRSVWPDEAKDFTPWLADNLERLGEALGLDLEKTQCEVAVGDFSCDLLAREIGTGRIVVIENQFGSTNHDHFGKVLTYAAGLDASALIWIAQEFREEHRQAIEWLNERLDENTRFFAVTVEVLQIDNSIRAVNFKPVVYPNEWQRAVRHANDALSPRSKAYQDFFQLLIDDLREKHRFTNARIAQPQSWYAFSTGLSGFQYSVSFAKGGRLRAEVFIDSGEQELNKRIFDAALAMRKQIESDFGSTLTWERLDDKRASRIATYRKGAIDDPAGAHSEYRDWFIQQLLTFKRVLGPSLETLREA